MGEEYPNETRTLIERMKAVSERVHQGNSRRRDSQRIEDAIIYIKYLESKLAAAEALITKEVA